MKLYGYCYDDGSMDGYYYMPYSQYWNEDTRYNAGWCGLYRPLFLYKLDLL